MEYATLRGTELRVSRIGLGTWAIGGAMWGGSDEAASIAAIHAAVDRGVTLIDTAPVYGFGRAEEIVGKALWELRTRHDLVIATKAGLRWNGGIIRDSSREQIVRECEASLRRLRTDHIDLYQIHWPDEAVPFDETAGAMRDLLDSGKIRAIGVSNFSPTQMDSFRRTAPLHACQPPYNLFERGIEQDVLPYCDGERIAVLAYGALCRGLLSGRMRPGAEFPGDDLRNLDPKFREPRYAQYLEAVAELSRFAQESYDRGVLELAVRWLLDRTGVTAALWGARRPEQVGAIDRVLGWNLDEGGMEVIDRILADTIPDPVGPEFMAPPPRR
jgi:aryl-alcohol dehydrogenase-like predicted oxidoreductase